MFRLLTEGSLAVRDQDHPARRSPGCGAPELKSPLPPLASAYTEVLGVEDAGRDDAGIVTFRHWGVNQDDAVVFEGERRVLIKRKSHFLNDGPDP